MDGERGTVGGVVGGMDSAKGAGSTLEPGETLSEHAFRTERSSLRGVFSNVSEVEAFTPLSFHIGGKTRELASAISAASNAFQSICEKTSAAEKL